MTAMQWCSFAFSAVVFGLLALAIFLRRGVGRKDRAGERTCATFHAPEGEPSADDAAPLGEALAERLHAGLIASGMECASGIDESASPPGYLLGPRKATIELVHVEDERWALRVLDPMTGGPGAIDVAWAIDAVLRKTPDVTQVRWHARESFEPSRRDGGHEHPTDNAT